MAAIIVDQYLSQEYYPKVNVHRPAGVNLTAKHAKFAKISLLCFAFFANFAVFHF